MAASDAVVALALDQRSALQMARASCSAMGVAWASLSAELQQEQIAERQQAVDQARREVAKRICIEGTGKAAWDAMSPSEQQEALRLAEDEIEARRRAAAEAAEAPREEPLLPVGWGAHFDPRRQRVYYFHADTGQSTWTLPTPTVEDAYTVEVGCSACKIAAPRRAVVDRRRPVEIQPDQSVQCHGTVHCACGASSSVSLKVSVEQQQRAAQQGVAQQRPQPKPVDENERDLLEANSDTVELAADVFSEYRCRSLDFGLDHPSDNITESASMSGVALPPADYPLREALGEEIVERGLLSKLQLEGALYACQRH